MKKIIIALALVLMMMVPVVAEGFSAGVELGAPAGVTVDYQVTDKLDVYATGSFGYVGGIYIDAILGAQYKVVTFTIGKVPFDVKVGLQTGLDFLLGTRKGLELPVRGTATVSHDLTPDFTTYIKGAAGYKFKLTGEDAKNGFSWAAVLGCTYHF